MTKYDLPPREDTSPLEWMRKASRAFENYHAASFTPQVSDRAGLVDDLREFERYRAEITPEEAAEVDEAAHDVHFRLFICDEEIRKRG